jgi:hypothetical protein
MALPILTQIQMACPGLAADVNLTNYITAAQDRTSSSWYADNYNEAVALRACHNWTLNNTRPVGEAGAIVSKHEGGQALTFSKGANANPDDLEQTVFGIRLKGLRKANGPSAGVVTGMPQPVIPPNTNGWYPR